MCDTEQGHGNTDSVSVSEDISSSTNTCSMALLLSVTSHFGGLLLFSVPGVDRGCLSSVSVASVIIKKKNAG